MQINERQFVEKLKQIRMAAHRLQREPEDESNYAGDYSVIEDIAKIDIRAEYDRLKAVLQRFDLEVQASEVDAILERNKDNFLFVIQDPPPWEGEYLVVRELIDILDRLIFAYSEESEQGDLSLSVSYSLLWRLLQGLERTFTVTGTYPRHESDFHNLAETVLICAFPKMIHDPIIPQQIKNFKPDTGIPETRTLIEYKYIDDKSKVPTTVDQLFADAIGYTDEKWNNLICVIYETKRFCTEVSWREEMKKVPRAQVILVRGVPPQ